MKISVLLLAGILISFGMHAQSGFPASVLPTTPKHPVVDNYFGKNITDDYRWLEEKSNPKTIDWFKKQGEYTNSVLDKIPGRDSLINTFKTLDALQPFRYSEVVSKLQPGGERIYFYRKTLASESVGKIYYRKGKTGKDILLFDPVSYHNKKNYSVTSFSPSPNARYLSVGLAVGGLEISTVKILDVTTKTFLPDSLLNVFGGQVIWSQDSKSLIYTPVNSADPTDKNGFLDTKSWYHLLHTASDKDVVLVSREKNPDMNIGPEERPYINYSKDYRYVTAHLSTVDSRMNVWIAPAADLLKPDIKWERFISKADSVYQMVTVGDKIFFYTVKGAPNGMVTACSAAKPDIKAGKVVIAESEQVIYEIVGTKDFLLITKDDVVRSNFQTYEVATGKLENVILPFSAIGSIFSTDPHSNDILLGLTSWTRPASSFSFDPFNKETKESPFYVMAAYPGIDDLVVEEIEIPSHDGAMMPLSIVYRKDLKKDEKNTCFMTGYGAYGASQVPYFDLMNLALLNKGVIIVQTHVRGGGEKGQNWHKAGYKTTKPNTWKDFIACGDWLIKNGYTNAGRLIGSGTSAGGILIGRAITERPDLFAAAINNVGATNILRMEASMNGPNNTPEFGTIRDSVECMALIEMDAVQHVKDANKYPAVLNVAGMNDPRVIVWQPAKFAAALQNASSSGKPVLLQVNGDNGHFTEDKLVTFRNFANMFSFGLWQAGHPDFQPSGANGK